MKKRVLLWLSWWVDSAVGAHLLQKEGYEVVAWFMKNYVSTTEDCPTKEDRDEAIKVAQHLWIKEFIIFDFREEYNAKVVEYIYEWYKSWITPNPARSHKMFASSNLLPFLGWIQTAIPITIKDNP